MWSTARELIRASVIFVKALSWIFSLLYFYHCKPCRSSACLFLLAGFNSRLLKSEDSCVIALERQNMSVVGWAAISYFCTNLFSHFMLMSACRVCRTRSLKQLIFNTLSRERLEPGMLMQNNKLSSLKDNPRRCLGSPCPGPHYATGCLMQAVSIWAGETLSRWVGVNGCSSTGFCSGCSAWQQVLGAGWLGLKITS